MLLSVLERMVLQNVLPKQDDIMTMRVAQELRQKLGFTEAEHAILQFKQEGEQITWQTLPDVEIEVGPKAKAIIRGALERMNTEKKLSAEHISLWDKFECAAGEEAHG